MSPVQTVTYVSGLHRRCIEQPGEPDASDYKNKVRLPAYPCREMGRTIFAYLGPGEPPLFPEFHFLVAPEAHSFENKMYHACNYLQANEGNIDPVHLSYLHNFGVPPAGSNGGADWQSFAQTMAAEARPTIEIERTRFGIRIYSLRNAGNARRYVRVTNYVFPNLSIFGGVDLQYGPGGYSVHWHVPIDDESHWRFEYFYHPKQPFDKAELRAKVERELTPDFLPIRNPANRYLQDRGAMKRGSYAGMGDYFPAQDVFVVQSQGSIQDRTQENLGTTDVVIAAARRMLFDAIEGLDRGADPPFVLRDPSENMFNDLVVLSDELDGEQDPSDYCAALARSGDYHAIPTEAT